VKQILSLMTALTIGGLLLAAATTGNDRVDRDYKNAYGLILEERWTDAENAFATLVRDHPGSRWHDDAAFWICFAKQKGRLSAEESFRCYRAFLAEHPHSEWRDDAARNMVLLGRGLAEQGRPEFLDEARAILEDSHGHDEPDNELMAMLESVAERDPERATQIVFTYFDKSTDARVRAQIVALLYDLESEVVTRKLIEILETDPSDHVRLEAIEALSDRRDSGPARDALLAVVGSEAYDNELRAHALYALEDFDMTDKTAMLETIILGTDDDHLFHAALEVLHHDAANSVTPLIALYEKTEDRERRGRLLHAIADSESAAAMTFLTKLAMNSDDPEVAAMAVHAFEAFPTDMAIATLEQLLESEAHWRVKVAAAYTIGHQEGPGGVASLSRIIARETHPEILRAAIDGLSETHHADAVPILVDLIRNQKNAAIRRAAIEALDNLNDLPAATEAMMKLIEERLEAGDND